MKLILLLGPAVIAGAVRYPLEGPISVADDQAERLVEERKAELAELGDDEGDEPDLDDLKVDALKALAVAEEVDLGDATKKAEIIAKIREQRAAAASQE